MKFFDYLALAIFILLLVMIVGCTEPVTGIVTNKEHEPAHTEIKPTYDCGIDLSNGAYDCTGYKMKLVSIPAKWYLTVLSETNEQLYRRAVSRHVYLNAEIGERVTVQ